MSIQNFILEQMLYPVKYESGLELGIHNREVEPDTQLRVATQFSNIVLIETML